MDFRHLIAELKARGVYRVAAFYAAGAWLILQVADVIFPAIGLPEWSIRALLAIAAMGFPIALVSSWLFDLTPQGIVESSPTVDAGAAQRWSPRHLIEFALILVLALMVGYLYVERLAYRSERDSVTRPAPLDRAAIAVMPFVNMSDVRDMEYLGDGIAEEILNTLARLSELNVAARTSSFHFKNTSIDIQSIGEKLGVGHILEGSVRYDKGRVRVNAQLVDTSDGFQLWSESYDREFQDVLSLQSEIALKVVDSLQVLLSAESRDSLSHAPPVDPVAYDYYLRGQESLRLPKDESNLQLAAELFNKALDRNPGFAEAYAGLCNARLGQYDIDRDQEHFEDAEAACHRALTLDRKAAGVYVALGNLYRYAGQQEQALDAFNTALALNDSNPDAHLGLADTLFAVGDLEQAEARYRRAIMLQPNYWRGLMSIAGFFFLTGHYEEAVPYYRQTTEFMTESESAFNNLGAAYFLSGDFEQAGLAWEKSLKLAPSARAYSNVASSLFLQGRFKEALPLYHKAVELAPEDFELWGNLGDTYRHAEGMGDVSELSESMYVNAIKLAKRQLRINPADADILALIGHYYAGIGARKEALDYIQKGTDLGADDMYVSFSAATAYAALGDTDRALEAVERALRAGYPPHVARADANLGELRESPGFEALLLEAGSKGEASTREEKNDGQETR
jgi:TolB-like protein/Flp pilus assembly protein TadD